VVLVGNGRFQTLQQFAVTAVDHDAHVGLQIVAVKNRLAQALRFRGRGFPALRGWSRRSPSTSAPPAFWRRPPNSLMSMCVLLRTAKRRLPGRVFLLRQWGRGDQERPCRSTNGRCIPPLPAGQRHSNIGAHRQHAVIFHQQHRRAQGNGFGHGFRLRVKRLEGNQGMSRSRIKLSGMVRESNRRSRDGIGGGVGALGRHDAVDVGAPRIDGFVQAHGAAGQFARLAHPVPYQHNIADFPACAGPARWG
jgi:hypothetical protein